MERCLSLVLDKNANISLTLEKMDARTLDEYISKNFSSSEDIRKKYAKEIDEYLQNNQTFINMVEESTGKKYSGSIVITEKQDDLSVKKIKVLYRKDKKIFNEIIKNKKFMLTIENRDYINYINSFKDGIEYSRIFSEYYARELRFRSTNPQKFNRAINSWNEAIKESKDYFEIIRTLLKEYELRYKDLNLDSLAVVYSKSLQEKNLIRKSKELEEEMTSLSKLQSGDSFERSLLMHQDDYKRKNTSDKDEFNLSNEEWVAIFKNPNEEPIRYKTYADEDGYPGDLDDSYNRDQYSNIDELENEEDTFTSSKTKTFHNNAYKHFRTEDY